MGREIGRKHDVAKSFAEGKTKVPHPSTRQRLEELYRKYAKTLDDTVENEFLFYKSQLDELLGLLPDDRDAARESIRAAMAADGDDEGAALRRGIARVLERMLDIGFAVQGKYPMQRHAKKRAPKKPESPDDVDYLAGIPPAEGVEEPPKPKKRERPPPETK